MKSEFFSSAFFHETTWCSTWGFYQQKSLQSPPCLAWSSWYLSSQHQKKNNESVGCFTWLPNEWQNKFSKRSMDLSSVTQDGVVSSILTKSQQENQKVYNYNVGKLQPWSHTSCLGKLFVELNFDPPFQLFFFANLSMTIAPVSRWKSLHIWKNIFSESRMYYITHLVGCRFTCQNRSLPRQLLWIVSGDGFSASQYSTSPGHDSR